MAAPRRTHFTPLWALNLNPRLQRQQRRARLAAIPFAILIIGAAVSVALFHTSAQPAATPAVTDPLTAATGAPIATHVMPAELQSAQATTGLLSLPWRLTGISADGRTLTIDASRGGGCTVARGFRLEQGPSSVEIWALAMTVKSVGSPVCPDTVVHGSFSFTLSRALGARSLLHPPYDHGWSIG